MTESVQTPDVTTRSAGDRAEDFRFGTEFHEDPDRPVDQNTPVTALRVFGNGDKAQYAGLYDTEKADPWHDHWAEGERLTDDTDWALVTQRIPGNLPEQHSALLGIAYARLCADYKRPLNVRVPVNLKPWGVWIKVGRNGSPSKLWMHVWASSAPTACVVAAVAALDNAFKSATAVLDIGWRDDDPENDGQAADRPPEPSSNA